MISKQRNQEKQIKLAEFQNKTKVNALKKMKEVAVLKKNEADSKR